MQDVYFAHNYWDEQLKAKNNLYNTVMLVINWMYLLSTFSTKQG